MKRDLTVFIKLMQYGSYFIMILIILNVGVGFYGLITTTFEVQSPSYIPIYTENFVEYRNIYLFNTNFSPLAGQLGIGYFLHTVSLPIIKNNAN